MQEFTIEIAHIFCTSFRISTIITHDESVSFKVQHRYFVMSALLLNNENMLR